VFVDNRVFGISEIPACHHLIFRSFGPNPRQTAEKSNDARIAHLKATAFLNSLVPSLFQNQLEFLDLIYLRCEKRCFTGRLLLGSAILFSNTSI
jgi:hypothetical protein